MNRSRQLSECCLDPQRACEVKHGRYPSDARSYTPVHPASGRAKARRKRMAREARAKKKAEARRRNKTEAAELRSRVKAEIREERAKLRIPTKPTIPYQPKLDRAAHLSIIPIKREEASIALLEFDTSIGDGQRERRVGAGTSPRFLR